MIYAEISVFRELTHIGQWCSLFILMTLSPEPQIKVNNLMTEQII